MAGWDGGIRMPTVLRWPKAIRPGTVVDEPTSQMDVFPTVLRLAQLKTPGDRVVDGRDLMPLLTGSRNVTDRQFLMHYCGSRIHAARYRPPTGGAVWKAHYTTPNWEPGTEGCYRTFLCQCSGDDVTHHDPPLLFDIAKDPAERSPISPESEPKFAEIISTIERGVRDHMSSLEEVESQFSLRNILWRPWLQPCCGSRDNKGTEFILTFTENIRRDLHEPRLLVAGTTQTPATVTVEVPAAGFQQTFDIKFGEVNTIHLPRTGVELRGSDTQNTGILVTATDEIVVYGVFAERASSDAYLALPTDVLGTEYFVSCYTPGNQPSQFGIVGVSDGTTVNIVPTQDVTFGGTAYTAGQTITVTLDRLQTLQVQSDADLTGSKITSDKNVAVLSGNLLVVVGIQTGTGDHIVEMIPPVDTWGKEFATVPLTKRTNGDRFRVIAARDNTQVNVTGRGNRTLNVPPGYWRPRSSTACTRQFVTTQRTHFQLAETQIDWNSEVGNSAPQIRGRAMLPGSDSLNFPEFLSPPRAGDAPRVFVPTGRVSATPEACAAEVRKVVHDLMKNREEGAVLFRGLPLSTTRDFSRVVNNLGLRMFPGYRGGSGIRRETDEFVYTASDESPEWCIEPHNELAQTANFPEKVLEEHEFEFYLIAIMRPEGHTLLQRDDKAVLVNLTDERHLCSVAAKLSPFTSTPYLRPGRAIVGCRISLRCWKDCTAAKHGPSALSFVQDQILESPVYWADVAIAS
ncbi:hypothetical protein Bbelb_018520 [Branchiostoma belcheri]|nr:hypothetical protein Bbelb_018520 [Branchiostoma belcheri]